jgi:hypothetical protein
VPVAVMGWGRMIGVAVKTEGVRVTGGVYCGSGRGWTVQPAQADSASTKAVIVICRFLILPLSALFYRLLPKAEILKYRIIDS